MCYFCFTNMVKLSFALSSNRELHCKISQKNCVFVEFVLPNSCVTIGWLELFILSCWKKLKNLDLNMLFFVSYIISAANWSLQLCYYLQHWIQTVLHVFSSRLLGNQMEQSLYEVFAVSFSASLKPSFSLMFWFNTIILGLLSP